MRAREPDTSGYADSGGVRVWFEVYGSGTPTLLLMPTWAIVHARAWKMQIPYLARHYRVVTFDPRGNGRTDRPQQDAAYTVERYAADALAVLDATDTPAAVLVAHCRGVVWSVRMASEHPERVLGLVSIASILNVAPGLPERNVPFDDAPVQPRGWQQQNRQFWRERWPDYVRFFGSQMTNEAHSTKVYDDIVDWGVETDGTTMIRTRDAGPLDQSGEDPQAQCRALRCPVVVINGTADRIASRERSSRLVELTGAEHLQLQGAGHVPHLRHPVVVNRAIGTFVDRITGRTPPRSPWLFARQRPRRALWISSAIGLGHVYRDLAIARKLRERVPELEIQWWAQPPVTEVLQRAGEIIHPASGLLASESAHWESESSEAGLHAFQAYRRMDEILCANFMLFDDIVRDTDFDLWIGDESWDVDHFLHENPDCKRAPFIFLTDVVGFLPVDGSDPRELELTADYNAEMIEHRERYPYLRDASLFIGSPSELPDASFGPGLPRVREWTSRWFDTVPYVLPFDAADHQDPTALRRQLGLGTGFPLLTAAVGGTAVGLPLLRLVAEAYEVLKKREPAARLDMITGPRIDPGALPEVAGMTKHGYVDNAFLHLAAADTAVVQGGLSTTMELTAAGRPFIYFPLAQHWEQQHFVAHRLDYYRAGQKMEYATTSPHDLAEAMARSMQSRPRYRPVPANGAAAAAERISAVLLGPNR